MSYSDLYNAFAFLQETMLDEKHVAIEKLKKNTHNKESKNVA